MADSADSDFDAESIPVIRHPWLAVLWLSIAVVCGVLGAVSLFGRVRTLITPR
jgi:hypothetical protein